MPRTPRRATPRSLEPRSLENAALFYLQRFATSAENLRRVLMRRVERAARAHGTDPAEGAALVEALVARFRACGLLDDRAYAVAQAATLRRRGWPGRAVRARLRLKGVAEDDVAAALATEDAGSGDPDLAAAVRFAARRRLGPFRPAEGAAASPEKDLAAFARAGFRYEVARRVLAATTPAEIDPAEIDPAETDSAEIDPAEIDPDLVNGR
ncbi:MAG: regulatory protein RecX [Rhodospirillales bacterium]